MNDLDVTVDVEEQDVHAVYPGMKVSRLTWEALPEHRWRAHIRLTPEPQQDEERMRKLRRVSQEQDEFYRRHPR